MLDLSLKKVPPRTGKKAGIWLALSIALGMHALFILLPISRPAALTGVKDTLIEVQLTAFSKPEPEVINTIEIPEPSQPDPEPEPEYETVNESSKSQDGTRVEVATVEPETQKSTPIPETPVLKTNLRKMDEVRRRQLTSAILNRQFFTEKSVTEQMFPNTLVQPGSGLQAEYHYPIKQSMITMLDQPMPDLPFAYEAGLVHFAYDPGIKGDLQRFWDVITPEFGWRTKYGTEVKCIWVLVIAGCAWK